MKKFTLIKLILMCFQPSFAQTLFFDNLNNTFWTTSENLIDKTLFNLEEIPLSKLKVHKDSINENVTICAFKDSMLTISAYNYLSKTDSLINTYPYSVLPEPLRLEIKFNDHSINQYEIGRVTTGNYTLLKKAKENYANFNCLVDIKNATKDGIYINGYVVNIPYNQAKKLNGKKINIIGKVTIVQGVEKDNDNIIRQGREQAAKHILKPKIKVL